MNLVSSGLENLLVKTWHEKNALSLLLRPFSWLYCFIAFVRRVAYRLKILRSSKLSMPVIVVGNITVGGTGKTPLVVELVEILKRSGYRPGIVSRGYRGKASSWPQQVRPDSDPVIVGDEAVLISRRTSCPMAVGPKRVAVAQALIQYHDCDIIVSDDGLQHYALQRNLEIAVIDGTRRFGNGFCLPAGPLREPLSRLQCMDLKFTNGTAADDEIAMHYEFDELISMRDASEKCSLAAMQDKKIHAIAGIGHPQRFFEQLRGQGFEVIEHAFPDHHNYCQADISFDDDYPVIMTEKDAVKCFRYANKNMWYLPIHVKLPKDFEAQFIDLLRSKQKG